jgi:hypothetical protein
LPPNDRTSFNVAARILLARVRNRLTVSPSRQPGMPILTGAPDPAVGGLRGCDRVGGLCPLSRIVPY